MEKSVLTLQQYRIRENRLLSIREQTPIQLTWKDAKKLFAKSGSINALLLLRKLKNGNFIGLVKNKNNGLHSFYYAPVGNETRIDSLLKQIPDLLSRLDSVYRVISVDYGTRIIE